MSGYSRENKRQNEALQTILRGGTPEKRIFVAQEDLDFKKKLKLEKEEEQKRIDDKLEITKEARVPWFCPECKKVMKRRLDDRMWYLYSHCLDCQINVENKMIKNCGHNIPIESSSIALNYIKKNLYN